MTFVVDVAIAFFLSFLLLVLLLLCLLLSLVVMLLLSCWLYKHAMGVRIIAQAAQAARTSPEIAP